VAHTGEGGRGADALRACRAGTPPATNLGHRGRQIVRDQLAASDTMLLGRRTYEEFAAFWPGQADDVPLAAATPVAMTHPSLVTHVAGVPIALPEQPLHRARALQLRGRIRRRLPVMPPSIVAAPAAQVGLRGYRLMYGTTSPPLAELTAGTKVLNVVIPFEGHGVEDHPAGIVPDERSVPAVGAITALMAFVMIINTYFGFEGVQRFAQFVAVPVILIWGIFATILAFTTVSADVLGHFRINLARSPSL